MTSQSALLKRFGEQYVKVRDDIRKDYDFPFQTGLFLSNTWDKYNVESNINALLSTKQPYFAYKEISFAAFCAWLIAPSDAAIRKNAIAVSVVDILSQFEADIIEEPHELRFALEVTNRVGKIGPDFFEEIYYPIGGLRTLLACPSSKEMCKTLRRESENIEKILFVAQMPHYASMDFQNGKLPRPASKNMIINASDRFELENERNVRGLRKRTTGPLWNDYEPSMLLLYAAHHVMVRPRPRLKNGSFLDAILTREISFDHDSHLVSEIIARAMHLKSVISKGIAQETMKILNVVKISHLASIKTEPKEFRYCGQIFDAEVIRNTMLNEATKR